MNGSWSFEVRSPTSTTAIFALPASNIIPPSPTPFPSSVTLSNSANGIQPTISWTLPTNFTPDAFRIQIYDRSSPPLANGTDNIIHTTTLSPTTTSYTFPTVLSTGQSLILGHQYTIDFQAEITRDGGPNPSNSNADILARSNSFFDFTPETKTLVPANIALPQVDGSTGVYQFSVGLVGPSSITFIDPLVATGYIYDIGAGDPNFASVILPDVGDGVFDLSFLGTDVTLLAGVQYFFPAGGVSEFKVSGIETSAGLDPADTSAFVTGLTFVAPGSFTGTMTPITAEVNAVPEPTSLTLLLSGMVGLAFVRRRRQSKSDSGNQA